MANWAITDYIIEGPIETLEKIANAMADHSVREDSDDRWEGNVLDQLGIEFEQMDADGNGYYMRGFIEDFSIDDGILKVYAEEAYGITDFYKVLQNAFNDIKIYWNVESQEDDVFATNDVEGKYFIDRYCVDSCIEENYEYEYFVTKESALKYVSTLTDGSVTTVEGLEDFNEGNYSKGDYINFHEYNVVTD